jgi:ribonuclease HI
MSDAPEVSPASAKNPEQHPLDLLTGGAFSAETSGDRAARIRDWLATQPTVEQLQDVLKELSARDKGAARAVRERLDEIRRTKDQEKIAVEWAEKAQALLVASPFNAAEAIAWQRDAAKAGAPLSREPLSQHKAQLAERVKAIEELQHRVQVQREVAVLLAQRIEVLSTKPWRDAQAVLDNLRTDVARWQEQAGELTGDSNWASVDGRFPPQLEAASAQLILVWDAFQSALAQTEAAAADEAAPLPTVPVWADELRVARGLPPEAVAVEPAKPAPAARSAAQPKGKASPEQVAAATAALTQSLEQLQAETAAGQSKAGSAAVQAVRAAIKAHGRLVDDALVTRVHEALVAAGEPDGWPRQNADKLREELVAKAEALLNRPEGQALGGRKIQETLRSLREQWKLADQGSAANHALWKKFDEACNAAHKVVEAWHEKLRTETTQSKAQRLALIEEIKAWAAQQAGNEDLKGAARALRQFAERWRESGHIGEKLFAELQPLFKQAMALAEAPLHAAQKASLQRRHAMIDEATALGEAPSLRIDAVKALQQRWQAEAQAVPLDRKHEQKLWDAFRKPLDEAFNRKGSERGSRAAAVALSDHDRRVLEASQAVEAANASGDVQQIRAAVEALEEALRGRADASAGGAQPVQATAAAEGGEEAAAKPAPVRPVVAVRGDDRPGMKKEEGGARAGGRPGDRRDGRDGGRGRDSRDSRDGGRFGREPREERGPRLADPAFRAQREAMEHAQEALRKLAAQAHGEALTQLLAAWEARDAAQLPAAQQLGGRVSPQVRSAWSQALGQAAQGDAGEALLRLEMAADVPTPAEHLNARRALQLQLLTRRNDPSPQETWGRDAARVLASARDDAAARRLQNVLRQLLRK